MAWRCPNSERHAAAGRRAHVTCGRRAELSIVSLPNELLFRGGLNAWLPTAPRLGLAIIDALGRPVTVFRPGLSRATLVGCSKLPARPSFKLACIDLVSRIETRDISAQPSPAINCVCACLSDGKLRYWSGDWARPQIEQKIGLAIRSPRAQGAPLTHVANHRSIALHTCLILIRLHALSKSPYIPGAS